MQPFLAWTRGPGTPWPRSACHASVHVAFLAIVRFFVPFLFALSTAGTAFAQQQEKTLEQRLLGKPDVTKAFDLRQGSTFGRQSFRTEKARVNEFYFTQKMSPKEYATDEYRGSKPSRFGSFRFTTREAGSKGKYEIPNAAKKADTKTMPVADAREHDRSMAVSPFAKAKRSYLGPEADRVHKALPVDRAVGWTGDLKPMTIDDVRTLLNKNK